ncbi:hypothetical protein Theba_1045 [Mesotoga prima MesG1.Ag.4.2]|uniref:Uncharacterized protein n=1 Tax=Mesotoga prima MesG1.Ag.4.2 TaxID=660470 RepID=I2F497_9BACT|nr:hypothetical protein Theba_1045 [Mesotoga prima MesG1.Ag.4.2]
MSVLLPSRHPDNAPGQDPCPSRKRDVRRIVSPYFRSRLLVSEANSRTYAFSALVSVQRSAKSGSLMGDPVQEHNGMTAGGH